MQGYPSQGERFIALGASASQRAIIDGNPLDCSPAWLEPVENSGLTLQPLCHDESGGAARKGRARSPLPGPPPEVLGHQYAAGSCILKA
jgi:hypothetical protein